MWDCIMTVRQKWIDEKKNEIIEYYNNGEKIIKEVAKFFKIPSGIINRRLREWGASNPDCNRRKRKNIPKNDLYNMYWKEEKHPREIAEKYDCSICTIHNYLKKYNIKRRTKSEARMGKLNPIYGVGHTKAARKKMSEAFSNGRKMGYNTYWGKGSYYNSPNQGKVWMRSGWETKTADYLTKNSINWYYEYEWLDINSEIRYLPDFFLPDYNLYIEVKGRKKAKDMLKFKSAQKKYNILLWDGEMLLRLGIIKNAGDTEINHNAKRKPIIFIKELLCIEDGK